jgi:hypothetical protein
MESGDEPMGYETGRFTLLGEIAHSAALQIRPLRRCDSGKVEKGGRDYVYYALLIQRNMVEDAKPTFVVEQSLFRV